MSILNLINEGSKNRQAEIKTVVKEILEITNAKLSEVDLSIHKSYNKEIEERLFYEIFNKGISPHEIRSVRPEIVFDAFGGLKLGWIEIGYVKKDSYYLTSDSFDVGNRILLQKINKNTEV